MTEQEKRTITKQFILRNTGKSIDKKIFAESIDVSEEDLESFINPYIKSGNIKLAGSKIKFTSMYFYDYLTACDLDEKSKNLILQRINGSTLQDIANSIEKTRETARLEEKNILQIIEDNFTVNGKKTAFHSYLFLDEQLESAIKNVKFDKGFYLTVSKKHPEFAGAKYFLSKFKKEKENDDIQTNIINAVSGNIDMLPSWFLDELIDYYHPAIIENGAVFSRYDGDALTEILKLHGPLKTRDLMDIYASGAYLLNGDDEIEGYDKNKPKTDDGLRYFTYIYPLHSDVIRTGKHGELRYYDTQKHKNKIEKTITSLKYPDIANQSNKINIKPVFELNKEALKKIDINNEYELHSLMRRYEEYIPQNITMKRIPMIQFD